ncbi:hypothetical protein VB005_08465 [Metarhizium brunneum]
MKATLLQREIEKENAERDLKETERLLREAQEATQVLIKNEQEVNSNLINRNEILTAQREKQSKEADDAREQAEKGRKKCKRQLQKTKKMIKKSEDLEVGLKKKIEKQKEFQRKCDTILNEAKAIQQSRDYFKSKDAKQSRIIQRLKDQVLNLESAERTSAFTKAIKDLNIEVDDLKSTKAKLQKDLEAEKRVKELSLSKAKEQAKIIKETEKKLAQAKGASLGKMDQFLKAERREKLTAGKDVADKVFALLRGIDSPAKAEIAYSTIVTYLGMQFDQITAAVQAEYEVMQLIEDLRARFQKPPETEESPMEDIKYVSGLRYILGERLREEEATETEKA